MIGAEKNITGYKKIDTIKVDIQMRRSVAGCSYLI